MKEPKVPHKLSKKAKILAKQEKTFSLKINMTALITTIGMQI